MRARLQQKAQAHQERTLRARNHASLRDRRLKDARLAAKEARAAAETGIALVGPAQTTPGAGRRPSTPAAGSPLAAVRHQRSEWLPGASAAGPVGTPRALVTGRSGASGDAGDGASQPTSAQAGAEDVRRVLFTEPPPDEGTGAAWSPQAAGAVRQPPGDDDSDGGEAGVGGGDRARGGRGASGGSGSGEGDAVVSLAGDSEALDPTYLVGVPVKAVSIRVS